MKENSGQYFHGWRVVRGRGGGEMEMMKLVKHTETRILGTLHSDECEMDKVMFQKKKDATKQEWR